MPMCAPWHPSCSEPNEKKIFSSFSEFFRHEKKILVPKKNQQRMNSCTVISSSHLTERPHLQHSSPNKKKQSRPGCSFSISILTTTPKEKERILHLDCRAFPAQKPKPTIIISQPKRQRERERERRKMPVSAASCKLMSVLAPSAKVALIAERGNSLLCLNIKRQCIDMAVVTHPRHRIERELSTSLPSIPTLERNVSEEAINKVAEVALENDVGGFVVAWPIQKDTGKLGAPCGRVLFTLEALLRATIPTTTATTTTTTTATGTYRGGNENKNLFSPKRPVCLWDSLPTPPERMASNAEEDEWGRSILYSNMGNCSDGKLKEVDGDDYHLQDGADNDDADNDDAVVYVHLASQEQYQVDERISPSQVWQDFSTLHWPHLMHYHQFKQQKFLRSSSPSSSQQCPDTTNTTSGSNNLVADWKVPNSDQENVIYASR